MTGGRTLGLVGCGLWGKNILRDLRVLSAEVVVADPDPAARTAAEVQGARTVAALDALPEVEGVVVATPASTHAEVIDALLPRGIPIFIEKPFTLDLERARRLAAVAAERLFVMHVWRYHPGIEALRGFAQQLRGYSMRTA